MTNAPHRITRVVSLQPSATATLAELGLLDRLVACTHYCSDVCPDVAKLPYLEDSWSASACEILDAKPELVIASVPYQAKSVSEILGAGVRFLGLSPRSLLDIFTDIEMIAGAMGVPERGRELVSRLQGEIETVRASVPCGGRRQKVFCEQWGKPVMASQRWIAELVNVLGAEFIGEPGKAIDSREVAIQQPDAVVAAWCGAGDRVPLKKVVEDRNWQEMPAVASKRIFCFPDEWFNTPGPTVVKGLHGLAAVLYPETFAMPTRVKRIEF